MTVLLSHNTALRFWRAMDAVPTRGARQRQPATKAARQFLATCERPCFDEAAFTATHLAGNVRGSATDDSSSAVPGIPHSRIALSVGSVRLAFNPLSECSFPLHVLVGKKNLGAGDRLLAPHVFAQMVPESSFVKAREGVLVSSPEFCFVQLAKSLPLPQLAKLGCELCGTYRVGNDGKRYDRQEALTTKKSLSAFVESASGLRGQRGARQALRWVEDGSASTRETELCLLLCLPLRLGGYGLPQPMFNARIDLSPDLRMASGKSHYRCDLYWPDAKLAVEYESDEHHSGRERLNADSIRRMNLNVMGIEVVTVTNRQVADVTKLRVVAEFLARKLHVRIRTHVDPGSFFQRQMDLRGELLDPGRNACGAASKVENVPYEDVLHEEVELDAPAV